jgi:predicted RND superfamily exporter protein
MKWRALEVDKLVDIIARRCRWLAAAAIISVAVPSYFIARIETDNSIEVWLNAGSSEYETYRSFLLLSRDGRTIGMLVLLERFENPRARRKTVEAVETAIESFSSRGFEPHLAGTPLMNIELDRGSQKASATFLPLALGISVIVLVFMLRSVPGVVAAMCSVGVTTAWTIGIMAMTGRTMNMVTVVLPALLFILSLSNAIHIASRFFAIHAEVGNRRQAVRDVLRELMRPMFLSSITTSVGFASLIVSDMRPVVDFGLFAAIGILLSFVFNVSVVPGVLSLLHARTHRPKRKVQPHWSSVTGALVLRKPWLILGVSSLALAVCVVTATKAKAESNILKFFPNESRISRDYAFVGEKLTGLYTVELDLHTELLDEFDAYELADELAEAVSRRPEVAKIIHYGSIVRLLSKTELTSPETAIPADSFKNLLAQYRLIDDDTLRLRMSILVNAMASADYYELLDFIDEQANSILGQTAGFSITGVVPLLNDVQQSLIDTQIKSFSIAAAVVLVMIGVFMRSVRAALASIVPNLLPVFAMFAVMVVLKIPLDAATVMIASVAIGIAADDTIHFLSHYRREKQAGAATVDAVTITFGKIGRAIVFTSVVTAAGFSILCLAQFRPIAYFGILTGITMLTALAGDLFILPACVHIFKVGRTK